LPASTTWVSRSRGRTMSDQAVRRVFGAADPRVLREIRTFVENEMEPDLPASSVEDLKLAVTEAASNAVRHSGADEIRISVEREGLCVKIVVEDDGVYKTTLEAVDGDLEGHRGFAIIAAMVDEFSVRRGTGAGSGTVVRMRKCAS
jgi:anti-sigma regulatory factor (Ser/Thr protein kinase)